jgi:uncharacterized repeat protein (TIGR03803 family)
MPSHKPCTRLSAVLAIVIAAICLYGARAAAQQESVLYSFPIGNGGSLEPLSGVALHGGDVYGAAGNSIFELRPLGGGVWQEKVIYFVAPVGDGMAQGTPVFDAAGNLYSVSNGKLSGVFELTPAPGGGWTAATLFDFGSGLQPDSPVAGVILDGAGNLYGTTALGGAYGLGSPSGTVFELMPQAGGGWTDRLLHSFGYGTDGNQPNAAVIFDSAGNLYGTTTGGGAYAQGIVFELMPQANGGWKEKILHSFGNGSDGQKPYSSLVLDAAGNLYGTTVEGGVYGQGTVFELMPQAGGTWREKLLHSFGDGGDGQKPYAGLIFDNAGNLYGAAEIGGAYSGGVAFELTPQENGTWTETILHNFGSAVDAKWPMGTLIIDASGNLYGTTLQGGAWGYGAVYEIMPK